MTVPRCPATSKTSGKQCGRSAGWGTPHVGVGLCRNHGGCSPGGIKQAQRLKAAATAQAFGLPVATSADQALEDEVARCAGTIAYLGSYIAALDPAQRLTGENSSYVELYERERDRLIRVAKAALDAGVAERQVAAIERSAEAFATVLRAILGELGVLDDPRAPIVVQRHLALLAPGAVDG